MAIFCNNTADCLQVDEVLRVCYLRDSLASEENVCDCSSWFGWVGQNCDETSGQLVYNRIISVFLVLWCLIVILLITRTILTTIFIEGTSSSVYREKLFLSSISSLFSLICLSVSIFQKLLASFDPTRFVVNTDRSKFVSETLEVDMLNFQLYNGMYAYALILQVLTYILQLYRWEKVFDSFGKFGAYLSFRSFRAPLLLMNCFLMVSFIITTILIINERYLDAVSVSEFFYLSGLLVSALITFRIFKFVRTFNVAEKTDIIAKTIKMRNLFSIINRVCVFSLIVVFIFSFFVLDQTEQDIEVGTFNTFSFLADLSLVFTLLLLTTICWFINSMSTGPIVADFYPRLCCIFSFWDRKNKELFPEDEVSS